MKRMLIIEDDVLSQKILIKLFHHDFTIDICDSAEEFYENFVVYVYDIVIMDISIKGLKTGLVLTKEIRLLPQFSRTPILCFTAHAFLNDRKTALDSGIDLFVTKPVTNKALKESVQYLLKYK